MGELVKTFARFRNSLRVFLAIRRISMDAIREAIEEAERDLAALVLLKSFSPNYILHGQMIDDQIASKRNRVQELKNDLMGDC
jgi:hypothetical protein